MSVEQTEVKRKGGRPRKVPVETETVAPVDLAIKADPAPVVGPEVIMSGARPEVASIDDEIRDQEFNPLNMDQRNNDAVEAAPEFISIERVEVPKIRKVVLKKIDRFAFKLGLERSKEKYRIMPGAGHSWAPSKKGDEFLTGLEDKPDIRERLERQLRVDLSPRSSYYATMAFRMEDKEHGQIMNFDDPAMGPYYEVVYYAMLASDLVANGLHEFKKGVKPFAEWYIENKDAEAEMGQADMTAEIEAANLFPSLSYSKRMDVAKLLGLPVWGVSDKSASKELWEFLKKDATCARAFLEVASLNDVEFAVRVLVRTAIRYNVIRRNKANDYVFNAEILGPTEDHVVKRLALATNSTLRIAIERQVKAKL